MNHWPADELGSRLVRKNLGGVPQTHKKKLGPEPRGRWQVPGREWTQSKCRRLRGVCGERLQEKATVNVNSRKNLQPHLLEKPSRTFRRACRGTISVGATVIAIVAPAPGAAQAQTAAADTPSPPRTPWGKPDLQGIWDFRAITPLERPRELAGKQLLTEKEAKELEEQAAQSRIERDSSAIPDRCIGSPNFVDCIGSYNQYWFDRGTEVISDRRTSLIVDPPDGRIPSLTPEAHKRADDVAEIRRRPAHGPEDRRVGARCIVGFNSGPPMNPSAYNNNKRPRRIRERTTWRRFADALQGRNPAIRRIHNQRRSSVRYAAFPDS